MSAPLIVLDSGLASPVVRCLISSVISVSKALAHWELLRLSLVTFAYRYTQYLLCSCSKLGTISFILISENSSIEVALQDPIFYYGNVAHSLLHTLHVVYWSAITSMTSSGDNQRCQTVTSSTLFLKRNGSHLFLQFQDYYFSVELWGYLVYSAATKAQHSYGGRWMSLCS